MAAWAAAPATPRLTFMAQNRDQLALLDLRLGAARAEVERRIQSGSFAGVEELRGEYPEIWSDPEAALELIYTEYVARCECGQSTDRAEWYVRFPEYRERLERLFGMHDLMTGPDRHDNPSVDTVPDHGRFPKYVGLQDHPAGYTLAGEIGRGGSAVVYRALQHSLNRTVAIKVIRSLPLLTERDGQFLRREAELAGRLQHPNIVQVFEVGEWNGMPFLSMELVAGRGLHTVLAECQRHGSAMATPDRAAHLVETLARAMSYAHEQGVVHRDLKPANVLIAPGPGGDGDPASMKIVDFGLAVVCDSTEALTQTLSVSGTPCYMAPEQAEARVKDVGPCSDVYALGAILYELLTGRPPFQGATVLETLDLVRTSEPVPPRAIRPRLPRDLETICLKCLRKSPDRRYGSARELAEDLGRFRGGRPIVARPVSSFERGCKWVMRHPAIAGLSFALLATLIGGSLIQANRYREAELARHKEQELNAEIQANLAGKLVASARALWTAGQVPQARELLKDCPEHLRDKHWKSLHDLCHAEIASLSDLEFFGDSLAVSPAGDRIAMHCKGSPHRIQVVNVKDGHLIDAIDIPIALYQLKFRTDSKTLIAIRPPRAPATPRIGTASNPLDALTGLSALTNIPVAEVTAWEVATKKPVHRWSIPNPGATAISGNGQRIAARRGSQLGVWDSVTGDLIAELPVSINSAMRCLLAWDDSGSTLAVRVPSEIQIWDTRTQKLERVLPVEAFDMGKWETVMPILKNFADPVFLRPDGKVVLANPARPIATTKDGLPTVRSLVAWNTADGREIFQIATTGITPRVEFAPDGRRMAIVSNQVIELHDAHTGTHLATLRGHTANIHMVQFSPDGRRVHSISGDRSLRTWDISPWFE